MFTVPQDDGETYCIRHDYKLGNCISTGKKEFVCEVDEPKGYRGKTEMIIFTGGKSYIEI